MNYEKVYCLNLKRRPEKWTAFCENLPKDWKYPPVERFEAIDGLDVPPPAWWKGGRGAWGCYRSHLNILENCLRNNVQSVFILEDDAVFCENFTEKATDFENRLPSDATWIYYGGQHLQRAIRQPKIVNEAVCKPFNINRTHAWAILGKETIAKIYQHLHRRDWTTAHHIDHHLGRLCGTFPHVYAPNQWLVGQREGFSDVACKIKDANFWNAATTLPEWTDTPFYAILGTHSSGSSALAGVCCLLGAHLGNQLTGAYGPPGIRAGEAIDLRRIFEAAAPVPATKLLLDENTLENKLRIFVNRRRAEALRKHTVAMGKYPQMAAAAHILHNILQQNLYVIFIERPLEISVRSLANRFPKIPAKNIHEHQYWIFKNLQYLKNTLQPKNYITIQYNDLLQNTELSIQQIIRFTGLHVTDQSLKNAVDFVKPEKNHHG
ncbi:MAG: glycosyltransferase family 25 protein [Planctomycetia bacterium]|nr:glycosyltransferase family 25 protein [Planctomycetia bacterium]